MFYNNPNTAFSIRDIFHISRKREKTFYPARPFSGLSFRVSGESEIHTNNKRLFAKTGSITYLPRGTDFEISTQAEEVVILHLNHFGEEEAEIKSFIPRQTEYAADLFLQMHKEWQARKPGYENRCTALLYTLFEQLEKAENHTERNESGLIKNAVLYMNTHFDRADLSIASLSKTCRISEVYFRKIFKKEYGTSPLKYLNTLRFNHACRLLESGYFRVNEVAAMSGFSDVKYFSTAFKKEYGMSPNEYRKS